jgi:hypothetical protein
VGQTAEVPIDRPAGRDEEDGYVARTSAQAPDIDSVTFVQGPNLHPGQLVNVKITDYPNYDTSSPRSPAPNAAPSPSSRATSSQFRAAAPPRVI